MRTSGLNPSEGSRIKNLTLFNNTGVPADPEEGEMAFDTSTSPSSLWIYQDSAWERVTTSANEGWTYVTDTAEFLTAFAAQKKNILMEKGVYTLTTDLTLYSDLTILGSGTYLTDADGTAGTVIQWNKAAPGGSGLNFVYNDIDVVNDFDVAPSRGSTYFGWQNQIGLIIPAGDTLVSYTSSGANRVSHVLGQTTATDDTGMNIHGRFPWDTSLAIYNTPTDLHYHTNVIKNFHMENILFDSFNSPLYEMLYIRGGINITLKKISQTGSGVLGELILQECVGVKIDKIKTSYIYSLSILGCSDMSIRDLSRAPAFVVSTKNYICYIASCFNFTIDGVSAAAVEIRHSTGFEISNYHRMINLDETHSNNAQFEENSFFKVSNASYGNVGTIASNEVGMFSLHDCYYGTLSDIHVRSAYAGTADTDAAFNFDNCHYITLENSSAPNMGKASYFHNGSANNREIGNAWQGEVLHSGEALTTDVKIVSDVVTGHKHTLHDYIRLIGSSVPIDGFDITDNENGTVNISDGTAILRSSTDLHASTYVEYDIPGQTDMVLTDNATNFIFAEYNAGSPQLTVLTDIPTNAGFTEVPLWFVTKVGNDLHLVEMRMFGLNYSVGNSRKDFYVNGFEHAFGSVVTEGSTPRSLDVTGGRFYLTSIPFEHGAFDTNTTDGPDTFTIVYQDGGGGWTRVTDQKTLSNTLYDDGDGTLDTASPINYIIFWVYVILNTPPELHLMYGRDSYANLASAQSASIPANLPPEFSPGSGGRLVAKIIINESDTNFYEIQDPFQVPLTSETPTIHNGLGGLNGGAPGEYYHFSQAQHDAIVPSYGGMWINNNTTPQVLNASAGTFNKITAFDNDSSSSSDITPDSTTDKDITVTNGGDYEVSFDLSFSGTGNATYHVQVWKNGTTPLPQLTFERKIGTGGDVGTGAICPTTITLAATDTLELRINSTSAADANFTAHWGHLNVNRVG